MLDVFLLRTSRRVVSFCQFDDSDPVYLEIEYEKGLPIGLNGKEKDLVSIIHNLNKTVGNYGVG